MSRVIVIGLDGATWDLLDPWIEDGLLPNITELRESGTSGVLQSTCPPDSIPAWPSMLTGKNPGKHGIFEFRKNPKEISDPEPVYHHGPWQLAPDKTMAFINVPGTYPLVRHGFNGYVISGLFTPSKDWEHPSSFTYPNEFADEVAEIAPDYMIDLWGTDEHKLLNRSKKSVEERTKVFKHVLEEKDVDVFWGVYTEPDRLMHRFWAYQDSDHPLYDGLPKDDPRRDALKDHFIHLDEKIGELLELVDEDDYVFIVSDHGFQPIYQSIDFKAWLKEHNYLRQETDKGKTLLARFGLHYDNLLGLFNTFGGEWLLEHLPKQVRVKLRVTAGNALPKKGGNTYTDTSASTVIGGGPVLTINTEDRGGPVPVAEREAVRDAVISDLKAFRDEHGFTGDVLPKEEFLSGPHTEEGPDIYWLFDHVKPFGTEKEGKIVTTLDNISKAGVIDKLNAWHDRDGIYVLAGPDVEQGTHDASIYDVLPTMLALLAAPVPADGDGVVLDCIDRTVEQVKTVEQENILSGIDI